MPTVLKSAKITPLLKKTGLDPDCLSNYRPISNLPPLISKLIERTVATQTVTHFTENYLFVPVQFAYRSGHSTETALVRVFNDLLLSVDRDNCSALVLLDLSAAFDTVDHQMLLGWLSNQFGVIEGALDWLKSYFSDQSQSVFVNGVSSMSASVKTGVPQGSVLGPLLFTSYTAPVYNIACRIHGVRSHFYVDDPQFSVEFPSDGQSAAYCRLCGCLDETKDWMTRNRLKLNDGKADLLLVYSTRAKRKPSLDLKLPNESLLHLTRYGILESPSTLSSRWRGICEVFEKRQVFILDLSGVFVGFSTALRPKYVCMPLYCQDSITAMLCLLACLKNLLIVFRECKIRQRG
jgi:hypothetical protein